MPARVKRVELQFDLAVIWIETGKIGGESRLREELKEFYETYRFEKLILNLESLDYCYSSDLSGMLSMAKQLGRENVKLCCPSKMVDQLLRIVSLHKVWDICETQQEAIDRFA